MVRKMVKLAVQLTILYLSTWSVTAIDRLGHCNSSLPNDKIQIKEFGCFSMKSTSLADQLILLSENVNSPRKYTHLELHDIEFSSLESSTHDFPHMKAGWLNMEPMGLMKLLLHRVWVSEIEENAFSTELFADLIILEISQVPLKTLKTGTFNGLKVLEILRLKALHLISIEKNVLAPISKLGIIWIAACGPNKVNRLEHLFGTVKMDRLISVWIFNCKWTDSIITERTFYGLTNVQKIYLSFNEIEQIEVNAFDHVVKTLRSLDLRNNHLKSLPNGLFKMSSLLQIEFVSNPWHCDCEMEHMRLFPNTTPGVIINRLVCNTPERYKGINLIDCPSLCEETTTVTLSMLEDSTTNRNTLSDLTTTMNDLPSNEDSKDDMKHQVIEKEVSMIKEESLNTIESTTNTQVMDSKESTEYIVSIHVLFDDVTKTDNTETIVIFSLITFFTFIAGISILVTLDKLFVNQTRERKPLNVKLHL